MPLIGCLGLDKSFNILTHHLLISKLGLLPPSSQHFCDHLNKMIVTMTHKVASLPADPHCVPHCPLLQLLPALTSLTLQFMGEKIATPPTPGPLQVPFTSTWKALLPSQCLRVNVTHPRILLLQPGSHKNCISSLWSTYLKNSR